MPEANPNLLRGSFLHAHVRRRVGTVAGLHDRERRPKGRVLGFVGDNGFTDTVPDGSMRQNNVVIASESEEKARHQPMNE